ncbi:31664_t:CDS:2 [Gigaspora margarita]|uniref:31664_t:CDS:1 n=1 Tax=Gigaspora margarita TaxID=4874 RepID=A0ABN7UQI4_GIGMA|nr:31664_t:CDS:2 [Gigaspora margarita]
MSNWKNPNNWHWTTKNCLKWAKEYFKEKLVGLNAEHEGITVKISDLTRCTGDADLNQRKGKLIPFVDLVIELTWCDGTEVTGKINIPELQGTEGDCEFQITVDDETSDKELIKEVIRTHLTPLITEKFKNFGKDMLETHSKDVYIEPSQLGASTPPRSATPPAGTSQSSTSTATSIGSTTTTSSAKPKFVNSTTIKDTIELQTSADQVYETLLDPGRVAAWTRSRPDIFRHIGSTFSLFEGNITGSILELDSNKKIVQTWRQKTWPEGHFSTVTLEFEQESDYTRVNVTQKGVPVGEEDIVKQNWQNYYWNPIKSVFGYGSISQPIKTPRKTKNSKKGGSINNEGGGSSYFIVVAIVLTAIVLGFAFSSRS